MDKRVIVITGPTATGKTALSVALAEALDGEIISADSMQIYKGMDIGTAKVSKEEARGIVHHMVDIADPKESFSVSRWVDMAAEKCEDILFFCCDLSCQHLVGAAAFSTARYQSGVSITDNRSISIRTRRR